MMKQTRKIITIDEELCTGCGDCVVGCSEGALTIVDGKAKLVEESFCDGFGDCVRVCPTDALTITEVTADHFEIKGVREHLLGTKGQDAVDRMEAAQLRHYEQNQDVESSFCGCPGSRMQTIQGETLSPSINNDKNASLPSELTQWPVQIHLVNPRAPYFKNRDLVIMTTCAPLAFADIHRRYLKGNSVVVGCPKLDETESYPDKLGTILSEPSIARVTIVRMEVPCCYGMTVIAKAAAEKSGRKFIVVQEDVIAIGGDLKSSNTI